MLQSTSLYGTFVDVAYWILFVIGAITAVGLIPSIIKGRKLLKLSSENKDVVKKEKLKRKGWLFIFLPFIIIYAVLLLAIIIAPINSK